MGHIDELLAERRKLAGNYIRMLRDCPQAKIPTSTPQSNHSYQSFCIYVDKRDEIMKEMRSQGIEVQIGTYALHMHRAFNDNPQVHLTGPMPGSRYAYDHCLVLPMYHGMTEGEQMYVVEKLINSVVS
jgi:dTDP-4-amino-4,6-dideoxygalactose transaminase